MSHVPNVFSPEGTPMPDRTVGELVAERPGRSRVFQNHKIDFCCQGGKSLREACEKKNVSLEEVLADLEKDAADPVEGSNPANLPPVELADYIVEVHHGFLRRELPRLHQMSQRVAQVHGGHTLSLLEVNEVYCEIFRELDSHMMKEEQVLFPMIRTLSEGSSAPMPLDGPISAMVHEHEDVGNALAKLNELTSGYTPPSDACNTYRALFAGLADLEKDLHTHIHLENSILFPAAEKLAA